MLVFPSFAANLAQTEDVVTKYADIVQSEAELGLPLSGKQKIHKIIDPVKTKNSHSYTLTL